MANDEREGFRGGRFDPSRGVFGQASVDVSTDYPQLEGTEHAPLQREQGPALGLRYRRLVWAHAQYQGRERQGAPELSQGVEEQKAGWRRLVDMSAAELGAIIGHARSFEQAMACANDWVRCHAFEQGSGA